MHDLNELIPGHVFGQLSCIATEFGWRGWPCWPHCWRCRQHWKRLQTVADV